MQSRVLKDENKHQESHLLKHSNTNEKRMTMSLLAAAPEIFFRVGSAQLFAAEGGENFFKIVMIVF